MRFSIVIFILFFSVSVSAQTGNKKSRDEFEKKFGEQTAYISVCQKKTESQNTDNSFIKRKIIIYGYELNGDFPTTLPKPFYPEIARRYRLFGAVFVEVFLDENGNAVYAKAKRGNKIFHKNAELAAYRSQFRAIIYCEKKSSERKLSSITLFSTKIYAINFL